MEIEMSKMPLFPLDVVLFPGWPMPLNIFEPRYLEMVRFCVEEDEPFGIVLIEKGDAAFDTAVKPCRVGCKVKVTQVEKLEDGRLLIMAIGQSRFRIKSLHRDKPYLVGGVVDFPFEEENRALLKTAVNSVHPLVVDYLTILARVNDNTQLDITQVPLDPEDLAFMASALLQAPLETKQSLLEAKRISSILNFLEIAYQHEVKMLKRIPEQDMGNFSVN